MLVVERFDRRVAPDRSRILRLVQEDFCQATGTSPLVKYENEGGPGLMALLGKNRHYLMHTVQRRHFNSTAKNVGYGATAEPLLQELIARTPNAIEQVQARLPVGFSQEVTDKVLGGLLSAARALEEMPAS